MWLTVYLVNILLHFKKEILVLLWWNQIPFWILILCTLPFFSTLFLWQIFGYLFHLKFVFFFLKLHVLILNCESFYIYWAAAAAKSLQSCPTLCDPIDGSPPDSPVPGILQARTLEWVAISFSNAWKWKESEVAQSCPTLSDPMDCNLPGSSIHGIFQARVLKWVAIAFSKPQ